MRICLVWAVLGRRSQWPHHGGRRRREHHGLEAQREGPHGRRGRGPFLAPSAPPSLPDLLASISRAALTEHQPSAHEQSPTGYRPVHSKFVWPPPSAGCSTASSVCRSTSQQRMRSQGPLGPGATWRQTACAGSQKPRHSTPQLQNLQILHMAVQHRGTARPQPVQPKPKRLALLCLMLHAFNLLRAPRTKPVRLLHHMLHQLVQFLLTVDQNVMRTRSCKPSTKTHSIIVSKLHMHLASDSCLFLFLLLLLLLALILLSVT
mmetsp:Transcript_74774/g.200423  ORF Transcript_74774/g.200423 Transcript_74774/m.200423 type:complete len:262 (+) Transcript_74774:1697-2482(+)